VDQNNHLLLAMAVVTFGATGRAGAQILFTRSTDGGSSWDNTPLTRNISNSPINAFGALFPRIAVTKTGRPRVYVVYDDDTGGPRQAYFVRSNRGANFKRPTVLSPGTNGGFGPVVDTDSAGTINIAWAESAGGLRQVVFTRSTDQGATFSRPVNVSNSSGEGFDPAIAIGGDDGINLTWEDSRSGMGEIFYSRSSDGGVTFSTPRNLSATQRDASDAEIAVDRQGRINVTWIEEQPAGGTRIMISRTTDSGGTFSAPLVIASGPEAEFEYLAIVAGGDTIYLAFGDDDTGQVYLSQSKSDPLNFSRPLQLSNADSANGEAKSPSIAVDGNRRIHVVWIDTSVLGGDHGVGVAVYRSSSDGQSFTKPVLIPAVVQPG
jgi:hypothetical protein